MSIAVSPILIGLAAHAGVELGDALAPIRERFLLERGMPRTFRSHLDPPSSAGSMNTSREQIRMHDALPYVAGTSIGDNVRITGAQISPGALWYGDMAEAKLVLKGTSLPLSVIGGVIGMRIGEVVAHPALADLEDVILAVIDNGGHTTFRTTSCMVRVDDPLEWRKTPRADWARELRNMEEAQGLHGRIAA